VGLRLDILSTTYSATSSGFCTTAEGLPESGYPLTQDRDLLRAEKCQPLSISYAPFRDMRNITVCACPRTEESLLGGLRKSSAVSGAAPES